MIERLITALPALLYVVPFSALVIWSVAHTLRGTSHTTDDIHNQPREEEL